MSENKLPLPYANIDAGADSILTLQSGDSSRSVKLYSPEGLDLVAALWVKLSAEYKLMYEPTWLGRPIIQFAEDVLMVQELVWKLRPEYIVECGVAHGGSLVLFASVCELLGHGNVIGVDVEIRQHNRVAIEAHSLSKRIRLIEGSSVAPDVVTLVKEAVGNSNSVLVVLDSNHSEQHVAKELELYSTLVAPGGYLVCMDGAQAHVSDIPRGKAEWKNDHPLAAIESFLARCPEFEIDPHYTRLRVTSNPAGFLRRVR
jgi:cephalosporin hydroxylase